MKVGDIVLSNYTTVSSPRSVQDGDHYWTVVRLYPGKIGYDFLITMFNEPTQRRTAYCDMTYNVLYHGVNKDNLKVISFFDEDFIKSINRSPIVKHRQEEFGKFFLKIFHKEFGPMPPAQVVEEPILSTKKPATNGKVGVREVDNIGNQWVIIN